MPLAFPIIDFVVVFIGGHRHALHHFASGSFFFAPLLSVGTLPAVRVGPDVDKYTPVTTGRSLTKLR
jgi:hypothetical protein